jgi:hypothetical protein
MLSGLRAVCAAVAERSSYVRVEPDQIPGYAATLPLEAAASASDPETDLSGGSREQLAAFWLTLDAINFGSGWFPTLRKRDGRSGYHTIASAIRERFLIHGRWDASELLVVDRVEIAEALGQDPEHQLMGLFATSLNDLGRHVTDEFGGRFEAVLDHAGGSAEALVALLARWACFADTSTYDGLEIPFLKRAQIAAADLHRSRVTRFEDLDRLTMFADNLVPHVLRLDGILRFDPELVRRIDREELVEHGSPEEVEIRACAVHAVELIVAARPGARAAEIDQALWLRGRQPRYKASPRHRCRCTAY